MLAFKYHFALNGEMAHFKIGQGKYKINLEIFKECWRYVRGAQIPP